MYQSGDYKRVQQAKSYIVLASVQSRSVGSTTCIASGRREDKRNVNNWTSKWQVLSWEQRGAHSQLAVYTIIHTSRPGAGEGRKWLHYEKQEKWRQKRGKNDKITILSTTEFTQKKSLERNC